MTRRHYRIAAALGFAAVLALSAFLGGCTPRLGWGLVLWTAPEGPLPAGSIVPVYIKSNIQKVYVVGVPGPNSKGKKIELPLWQIELFSTRGAAAARVKAMGDNISLYMVAARDGLPLRDRPSNGVSTKRVYRLREGQSVKVLDKVEGDQVNTGGAVLPGSWYQVLTDDGTTGYIFSYAFRIYDEAKEGPPVIASAKALSGRVDLIFSRLWRPQYFQEMLDDGRIDLDYFSLRFGVFADAIHRQVRVELPAASQVFNYTSISETDGVYSFEGTPLKVRIESDKRMSCSWTAVDVAATASGTSSAAPSAAPVAASGTATAVAAAQSDSSNGQAEEPPAIEGYDSAGAGGSAVFVVLTSDPLETIRLEALRRQQLLASFVEEAGAIWVLPRGAPSAATLPAPQGAPAATATGRLEINKNGRFAWKNRGDVLGAYIPSDAGDSGEIAFRLYLDPSLTSSWGGVVSLRFDPAEGAKTRQRWLDFAYRRTPSGLVLAPAVLSPGTLVVSAAQERSEPLILEPATE